MLLAVELLVLRNEIEAEHEGKDAGKAENGNLRAKGLDVERAVLGGPDVRAGDAANVAHRVDNGDRRCLLGSRLGERVGDPGQNDKA